MDELFGLVLFAIFILAPLLEQIRKRGQPPKQPPKQPPVQRPVPRHSQPTSEQTSEPAAVLVPDDLWQILTGEARVPTPPSDALPPAQQKRPWEGVYLPPEVTDDEEAEQEVVVAEDVNVEVVRSRRDHELWHQGRRNESLETEPVIVSLETNVPSAAARHATFHKKIRETEVEVVQVKRQPLVPRTRSELQRAFMLQEVFGRPRGLE